MWLTPTHRKYFSAYKWKLFRRPTSDDSRITSKMLKTLLACLLVPTLTSGGPGIPTAVARRAPADGGRGKFHYGGTMNCTWISREGADERVRVSVKCEDPVARVRGGVTDRECRYEGRPSRCPAFRANPRGFWKQVSRSFRRLGADVCSDQKALVRARACKGAPRESHFKLDIGSSVVSAQSGGDEEEYRPPPAWNFTGTAGTACTEAQRKAEERCGSFWAGLCTFVLSALQTDC
ncbi:fibroblast growth factor-binding protein 1 [Corythoichthys intestinalis]|uniref:fibroblast growth factor-binding protein 1 n=1 Tax=Corythoichthys intestinalis TaxID=161448 RepID=UPI0025A68D9B|nr:fibroblast growth factor-binding protein 1 [Corythoichthys intestinalis]XP_061792138.1 fibroblast growth factor-binding protein 1-like [Nerophis lumbriciformis]